MSNWPRRRSLPAAGGGERLSLTSAGQVLLQFRHPWRDGATHAVFDPVEFLGRLAVLVPRPRINLLLYHGVLACPRCGGRRRLIARIEQAAVIRQILRHRGLPEAVPTLRPARAPPLPIRRHRSSRYDHAVDEVEAP